MLNRVAHGLIFAQPLVFAAAIVLVRYMDKSSPIEGLIRPLGIAVLIATLSLAVAWIVTRSTTFAAILASAFVLFSLREVALGLSLVLYATWWLLVTVRRRKSGESIQVRPRPSMVANATAVFALVYAVVSVAMFFAVSPGWQPALTVPEFESTSDGDRAAPNIYLILLDGYPRADVLSGTFGIGNRDFLNELMELDFEVASAATSNYSKTWLTLASAFNGAYIDDLLAGQEIPANNQVQRRWLHSMINEASALTVLREHGYTIRTIPSPYTSTALSSADDVVGSSRLTEFEGNLLAASPWSLIFRDGFASWMVTEQQLRATEALAATVELAKDRSGPQFVFSHIHSPHVPFVLHLPRGASSGAPHCWPLTCSFWHATIQELGISAVEYRDGLAAELATLNELVTTTLTRLTSADPNALVIVMSDHGSRYSITDPNEQFKTLFAARTPGATGIYPSDISPVNVMRILLERYFETDSPALPYRAWNSGREFDMSLSPHAPG